MVSKSTSKREGSVGFAFDVNYSYLGFDGNHCNVGELLELAEVSWLPSVQENSTTVEEFASGILFKTIVTFCNADFGFNLNCIFVFASRIPSTRGPDSYQFFRGCIGRLQAQSRSNRPEKTAEVHSGGFCLAQNRIPAKSLATTFCVF